MRRRTNYKPRTRVVLLFSGGLESTTLAHIALREKQALHCLFVRYGQPAAAAEYDATVGWCRKHAVTHADLILAGISLGEKSSEDGAPGPRVVPARNLLLLALAANYATAIGAAEVWYGAHQGDAVEYADCRPRFVDVMGEALGLSEGLRLRAPMLATTRAQVHSLASAVGVDMAGVWSCYTPVLGDACGTCGSCRQDEQ